MRVATEITGKMLALRDDKQALHLSKFFKTGKGEYGEGDRFLGIKVPVVRSIVKEYRVKVDLDDIRELISSPWHELRLAGFLLLVELYQSEIKAGNFDKAGEIVGFYLANLQAGNNWDLVDLVSYKLLGDWTLRNPEFIHVHIQLASRHNSLWHQRVSIVSTLALIREGKFKLTFRLAEMFLSHPHDLMHKATGWMLREIGKRGGKQELTAFLEAHKSKMPRTALRYAIERFTPEERARFMRR